MASNYRLAILVLMLTTACVGQEGLTIRSIGKQKYPATQAEKIYLSAWSVVQHEFAGNRPIPQPVALVLGSDKNMVLFKERQIMLVRWDPYLFAQGVVMLAFDDLTPSHNLPLQEKMTITRRAIAWADSTVEVQQIRK